MLAVGAFGGRRTRAILALITGALAITAGLAQQSPKTATPKFEVASIRPCNDAIPADRSGGTGSSPGRLTVNCGTVELLIRQAYVTYADGRLNRSGSVKIEGGPGWIHSEHYDINAKAEGSASREMMNGPMMQALLEERFNLRLHRETREIPVYALTVAKGGFRLRALPEGNCTPLDLTKPPALPDPSKKPPCRNDFSIVRKAGENGPISTLTATGLSLDLLATFLPAMVLDRPVINKTGMFGTFNFKLDFAPDETTNPIDPLIFTAIQDQLGLKLEPAKGPGEFLVIDHVEKPSEN
jgi:uncharacterized protein (TIGR03435 family)